MWPENDRRNYTSDCGTTIRTPKQPFRHEIKGSDYEKFADALLMSIATAHDIPVDILKHGSTGVHKMRKIKIAQTVKNEAGEITDIKNEKEYRNKTLVVATHEYLSEYKLADTKELLFKEEVEIWREFEA